MFKIFSPNLALANISVATNDVCEEKCISIFRMKSNQKQRHSLCLFQTNMVNQIPRRRRRRRRSRRRRRGCVKFPSFQNKGVNPLIPVKLAQPQSPQNNSKACLVVTLIPPATAKLHRQANQTALLQATSCTFERVECGNSFVLVILE
ncbi:hypothetical protein PanWU01x14_090240 [Parasponia andersonii]|uniref:Uncharacterized protein n=1 Tax=Parasponia andersonii TaxID=3476 RepID=A0A2P5D7N6_PARAD|nr:hypothetical protein PanWU01x14_090240 [Parasponia andersonii]